jgi:hypothetical protein
MPVQRHLLVWRFLFHIQLLLTLITANSLDAMLRDPRIRQLFYDWHMRFRIVHTSPYRWYSSYLKSFIDTIVPDPFVLVDQRVPDGEIAIMYNSRTKNTGLKNDTIPLTCLASEPPTGKNKTFTLLRGDHIGTIHTTKDARGARDTIVTMEGKEFPRADACELKPRGR